MSFVKSFRGHTHSEPDYGQAFAYDAVYLVRDAILKYGFSREGVKHYLDQLISDKLTVNGAAGAYMLGPDHDARRTMYIVDVVEGKHRALKALTAD
jgi:ABC-type branched-subunit amino acid transport system substrate-binding protein